MDDATLTMLTDEHHVCTSIKLCWLSMLPPYIKRPIEHKETHHMTAKRHNERYM